LTQEKYDRDPKYYNKSETIWLTASKQVLNYFSRDKNLNLILKNLDFKGLKTASSFWIGSEIFDRETDLFLNYASNYKLDDRIGEVVSWFSKFNIDLGFLTITDLSDAGI
jgi:hypothetical protein